MKSRVFHDHDFSASICVLLGASLIFDRRAARKLILYCLPIGLLGFSFTAWYVGGQLIAPSKGTVGPIPRGLTGESVSFLTASGLNVQGWHFEGRDSAATVLLLHSIRSDRRSMLPRARLLIEAGYSTLLVDLPGHGESDGDVITAGWRESDAVTAAVDYIKMKSPTQKVAIVGRSLGGAAALFASPLEIDALVLESVYPTITDAIHNRVAMRVGPLHHIVAPALTLQLYPRLGVSASQISPIEYISKVNCPVLVVAGDRDLHTTLEETSRLCESAKQPREMFVFEGAAHVDFCRFDQELYRKHVLSFVDQQLK